MGITILSITFIMISVLLSYLTTYHLPDHISLMIDKSIVNFGSIGLPVLLIWIQYLYTQNKKQERKERKQREKEQREREQHQEKNINVEVLKSGDNYIMYLLKKITFHSKP